MAAPAEIPFGSLTTGVVCGPDQVMLAEGIFKRLGLLSRLLSVLLNFLDRSLEIGDLLAASFFDEPAVRHMSGMFSVSALFLIEALNRGGLETVELIVQLHSAALQSFTFLSGASFFRQRSRLFAIGAFFTSH